MLTAIRDHPEASQDPELIALLHFSARRPMTQRSSSGAPVKAPHAALVVALVVCAVIAGLVYLMDDPPAAPQMPSPQQTLLDASREKAGDPELAALFDDLNARHFSGELPNVKVLWDDDLRRLDVGDYRLNGMTDGKTILIKATLKDDDGDVRRTLCHEMVHVKFFTGGNRSTAHDARFQSELRRVFDDGCFPAIWASPEEKASLGKWIESERTRLDAAGLHAEAQLAAIKLETEQVERIFSELNERIRLAYVAGSGWPSPTDTETAERQRTALQESTVAYNSAVTANESARTQFNDAVQRHNLMMAYPDGLAEDRAKGLIR